MWVQPDASECINLYPNSLYHHGLLYENVWRNNQQDGQGKTFIGPVLQLHPVSYI